MGRQLRDCAGHWELLQQWPLAGELVLHFPALPSQGCCWAGVGKAPAKELKDEPQLGWARMVNDTRASPQSPYQVTARAQHCKAGGHLHLHSAPRLCHCLLETSRNSQLLPVPQPSVRGTWKCILAHRKGAETSQLCMFWTSWINDTVQGLRKKTPPPGWEIKNSFSLKTSPQNNRKIYQNATLNQAVPPKSKFILLLQQPWNNSSNLACRINFTSNPQFKLFPPRSSEGMKTYLVSKECFSQTPRQESLLAPRAARAHFGVAVAGAGAPRRARVAISGPGWRSCLSSSPFPGPGERLWRSPLPPGAPGCGRTNEWLAEGSKARSSAWRN